jgi:hypothetical protein
VDDDSVHRQRIGLIAPAAAERARDRGRDAAAHGAPAEIICISMTPGKTSAMPASASVPSFETNQVSINPVAACATMTSTLGHAIRNKVGTIGPRSNTRVRGLSSAGATTAAASRAPTSTVASRVATLILPSSRARGVCGSSG